MGSLMAGESLRILLVSAEETTQQRVAQALAGWVGDHRLYWVSQPDLAHTRAVDVLPHVVLVDDDLGGANPVTLIGRCGGTLPDAAIIAIVTSEAMGLARQAVLAGARGFITKPIHDDDLLSALRQVLSRRTNHAEMSGQAGPAGRIIAFCAPKGGTGRTTLAINTAVSLQQLASGQVVLMDADYAAPAVDVFLNLDASRNIFHLLPRLSHLDADLISSVLASHTSGIQVLMAPPPADLSSPISLPQVQQVLGMMKRMFPWVIVDLGLPLDDMAFAFLDGADRIIVSVLPGMVGLRNSRHMLDQLREQGYPEDKVWLVLNRATLKGGVPAKDIEERLRLNVRHRIVDDQPLATHTVNRGVPLVMSHPQSAVARGIRGLAELLVKAFAPHVATIPAESERSSQGLFTRLMRRAEAVAL